MDPSLAMEQAKERATDLTTVGNSSVVYRYTIPQHTCNVAFMGEIKVCVNLA